MERWQERIYDTSDALSYFLEDHGRKLAVGGLLAAAFLTCGQVYSATPKEFKQTLHETVWKDNRPSQTSPEDQALRDQIFDIYGINEDIRPDLEKIPFANRKTTNNGGGMYYHYDEIKKPWIEVYSNEPEAIVHEYSHAAYEILSDRDKGLGPKLESELLDLASKDPKGYYGVLMFGDNRKFKGLWENHNYTEMYAAVASFHMGGLKEPFPDSIVSHYKPLFIYADGKPPQTER